MNQKRAVSFPVRVSFRGSVLVACVVLITISASAQKRQKPVPAAQHANASLRVTPEMLRPHLRFLASDELEGRETGERGQHVAARYIAAMFERYGLTPLGDSGTYLQNFHLYRESSDGEQRIAVDGPSGPAVFRGDDVLFTMFGSDTVSAPVVFAGYGINDSVRYGYSDYQGIDVAGKIVLILGGVPRMRDPRGPFSKERTRWHDMSSATPSLAKVTAARMAGARALLIVPDLDEAGMTTLVARVRRRSSAAFLSFTPPRKRTVSLPVAFVSPAVASALLNGERIASLKRRIDSTLLPASFAVPGSELTITTARSIDTIRTANVVGMVEGSDTERKSEAVVFSAHYDHLGVRSDGAIYHGADDDASGTSAVLAFAELLSRAPKKPRRSMIFLCNTGEEKGLLGSQYYTDHPAVPLASTVCDLNVDMIGRRDSAHIRSGVDDYVYVIGSKRHSRELDDALRQVNNATDTLTLDYTYDSPSDPERLFERSDHYNFAKHGIPVIFFHTGEHADYHRTTDTVEKIEFERMARVATLICAVGFEVANRGSRLRIDPVTSEQHP